MGTDTGQIVKSGSMVRAVPEVKWSADAVMKITGTPMRPSPNIDGDIWIEETPNPHERLETDVELVPRPMDAEDLEKKDRAVQRIRITKNDLLRYGYTEGCPKCQDLEAGKKFSAITKYADTGCMQSFRPTTTPNG